MTTGVFNDIADIGAEYRARFTFTDDDGNAVDLTGCVGRYRVWLNPDSESEFIDFTSGTDSELTLNEAGGYFDLLIPGATVAGLEGGNPHLFEITWPGRDYPDRVFKGVLTASPMR